MGDKTSCSENTTLASDLSTASKIINHAVINSSKFVNNTATYLMDPADLVSVATAKRIMLGGYFEPWNRVFHFMTIEARARLLQATLNLASVTYQYWFASWTAYLFTTISGLRKIYSVLFKNPVYLIPFFLSFYFRVLGGSDLVNLERVEAVFGGSQGTYAAFWSAIKSQNKEKLTSLVFGTANYVLSKIGKWQMDESTAEKIALALLTVGLDRVSAKLYSYGTFVDSIEKVDTPFVGDSIIACYRIQRESINFDDTELDSFYRILQNKGFLISARRSTRKSLGKGKRERNIHLDKILEKKIDGKVQCLTRCSIKNKTVSGEVCESPCGRTHPFEDPWCYVEGSSSKKAVQEGLYKKWNKCHPDKFTQTPVCFTGSKYRPCEIE
jgi:hypothetical protein